MKLSIVVLGFAAFVAADLNPSEALAGHRRHARRSVCTQVQSGVGCREVAGTGDGNCYVLNGSSAHGFVSGNESHGVYGGIVSAGVIAGNSSSGGTISNRSYSILGNGSRHESFTSDGWIMVGPPIQGTVALVDGGLVSGGIVASGRSGSLLTPGNGTRHDSFMSGQSVVILPGSECAVASSSLSNGSSTHGLISGQETHGAAGSESHGVNGGMSTGGIVAGGGDGIGIAPAVAGSRNETIAGGRHETVAGGSEGVGVRPKAQGAVALPTNQ